MVSSTRLNAVLVFVLFTVVALAHHAAGDVRKAEAILEDIEKIKRPQFDPSKRDDEEFIKNYRAEQEKADLQAAELILELYKSHPDHERLKELMPRRWGILLHDEKTEAVANQEMDEIIKAAPDSPLAGEARYLRAMTAVQKYAWTDTPDPAKAMEAVEAFMKASPSDKRAVQLLGMVADSYEAGSKEQAAVYQRMIRDFPDSSSAKYAKGKIRQSEALGKPFELSFNDATTGETVDMKDLRGKVVVVDFWATWCGPCVADMPHMKELYAKHHDQGVEFIGVSLDAPEAKGGLDKLKKFVVEKEIPWPQYYQGNGWESEFSMNWGINGIPALFVVDKKGHLRSVEARGKLEELIPQLLAEKN